VMRWLFIWQSDDLNMAYEEYVDLTENEARDKFAAAHPEDFPFAVICGEELHVAEFHA
jgi:hypothetical protein